MSIKINGESFDITIYDTKNTLLQRYSIQKGKTLPQYLSIEDKEFEIEPDKSITIRDVRDILRDLNMEEMTEAGTVEEIMKKYPKLTKRAILVLFLLEKYKNILDKKNLLRSQIVSDEKNIRKIDQKIFFNVREIEKLLDDYFPDLEKNIKKVEEDVKKQKGIIKFSETTVPVEISNFQLEEVTSLYILDLPSGTSLDDVFDAMETSRDIPFIHLSIGNKNWYKVFQHVPPTENWLKNKIIDGIYFKILNVDHPRSNSKDEYEHLYSTGIWYENNNISISSNVKLNLNSKEADIKEKFFNSFEGRLSYKLSNEGQIGVKGKFSVENFSFNKAVFADMVDNYNIFSYFLFFDERLQEVFGKYRSAITKDRFTFYYEPDQNGEKYTSLTITVTSYLSEDDKKEKIDVRVSRASTKQQVESFRSVFSRLLKEYEDNYQNVINEYKKYIPNAESLFEKYIKKPKEKISKEDKKSGKRLIRLKRERPGVFRSGYASICQPKSHQPYILDKKDLDKFVKKYGEHKVMEFLDPTTGKKDWYACEPREQGEVKTHIYPGLQENKRGSADYKKEVPFFPCCFTEDQYIKPAAELRKRVEEGGKTEEYMEDAENIKHIFSSNKLVPPGRFGQIPYYLNFVVRNAGYEAIGKGKQSIFPILRFGVIESPDSFLHCLEKAFNLRYSSLDKEGKIKAVSKARKDLTKLNFAVAKQELFDFSDKMIEETLLDDLHYLDPGLWYRLAELKYDCNIFIYQISEEYPNGAVVIPRFSQAYLFSDIPENRKSVFIVKKSFSGDFPFQCEILVKYDINAKKERKFSYFFEQDPFVDQAIKVLYESNSVSVVTPYSSFFYAPVQLSGELFQGVKDQYIDQNGKTRMLNYENGVSLMTSPLPPLDVPINMKINSSTTSEAIKFIKNKGLVIEEQDGSELDDIIQGFWVKSILSKNSGIYYGYIPIKEEKGLEKVDYASVYTNDPLRTDKISDLEIMRKIRKVADFLKQYTLFQYSLDPEHFGKDSFVVIPDHKYEIEKLEKRLISNNSVMYRNGKLIVLSEEIAEKLLNFLKVSLLNDHSGVMNFSKRTVVKDYYRTLNDFRKYPQQLIFLTRSSVVRWKMERKQNIIRNAVSSEFLVNRIEPYFLRNYNIKDGNLVLVQNVKDGELNRALAVARKWEKDQVNPGYNYEGFFDVNYRVHKEEGETSFIENGKGKEIVNIIEYSNGDYAALLFFKNYSN